MSLELIELKAKSGSSKKPPLLFVHGSFCSAPIWRYRFMPYFAELGYDCYAVSLSGHGQSGSNWSLHLYGLDDYVKDIEKAVESIGQDPIIIGHSLGGMVVQKYIESHACKGAILMNSLPPSGSFSSVVHMMSHTPDLYWTLNQAILFSPEVVSFDALKRMLVSEDTHPASLAETHGLLQAESLRALTDITFMDIPRKQALSGFPILVIGGDADVMIPHTALRETATFHGADLHIVKDGPHALMLDKRWKDSASYIADWIAEKV